MAARSFRDAALNASSSLQYVALFKKIPYHFPFYSELGDWTWNEETNKWVLYLHPKSKDYLHLRLTLHFHRFNDERVHYYHLTGLSRDLEALMGAFIKVSGSDGREYLWERVSEYWRNEMNSGKRCEPRCDFPAPVSSLKIRSEDAKNLWHPANR